MGSVGQWNEPKWTFQSEFKWKTFNSPGLCTFQSCYLSCHVIKLIVSLGEKIDPFTQSFLPMMCYSSPSDVQRISVNMMNLYPISHTVYIVCPINPSLTTSNACADLWISFIQTELVIYSILLTSSSSISAYQGQNNYQGPPISSHVIITRLWNSQVTQLNYVHPNPNPFIRKCTFLCLHSFLINQQSTASVIQQLRSIELS